MHKMRAEEDAIMVGTRTVLLDNPSLTTRYWTGKNPLRITIDKDLKIPDNYHLLDKKSPSLIFTQKKQDNSNPDHIRINFADTNIIPQILAELYNKKIQSLIVEGGSLLLSSFIQSGLWDEAEIEIASVKLKRGIPAPTIKGKIQDVKNCKQSTIYSYRKLHIP
jgi:diaminohydroxyphosphoribosylaminopyrimidine deaminase/5-amino-6-(5-phosphoribosylamino)uracil reductase